MKILIDENLPVKLKSELAGYDALTVHDMTWDSFSNGELLKSAEEAGFDVLITSDKNLKYQQNLSKLRISIVVLDLFLLKWEYVEILVPKIIEQLSNIVPAEVYLIK